MQRVVISSYDESGNPANGHSAQSAVSVVTSDSVNLVGGPTKGIYVGGTGDISLIMNDGSSITFTALAAGVVHSISAKRINATGTTATGIIALY